MLPDKTIKPDPDPGTAPTEISKPVGDAIPTPVEPGLDQPLPEKTESEPEPEPKKAEPPLDPLGDTDPPPGVPPPSESDFA
jgi:hypothetical protein